MDSGTSVGVSSTASRLLGEALTSRDRLRRSGRDLDELVSNIRDEAWQADVQAALRSCAEAEHCRQEEARHWRRIAEDLEHLETLVPMPDERNPT